MHIMEGFLPHPWWEIWFALSLPVLAYGLRKTSRLIKEHHELLPLLAVSAAFIFVLSSLKLPSVAGSSSHPTGTGMGAILFGPGITAVLSVIVLIYQALFLAHGGLTTLGANVFSMGIAGPAAGYLAFKAMSWCRANLYASAFVAAMLADLTTYITTSLQLALAFPAASGGVATSFQAFLTVFAITQLPLAAIEGLVTALMFKYLIRAKSGVLVRQKVITQGRADEMKEMI
jgi:cobalt/nickel transport system permease protein